MTYVVQKLHPFNGYDVMAFHNNSARKWQKKEEKKIRKMTIEEQNI